jgi:hypothetical protein
VRSCELRVVWEPYEVVSPYSTCVSEDSFVLHVMVAPDEVIEPEDTEEMTGGVVSDGGLTGMFAEHEAVVPPFEPVHCQRYSVAESA